MRLLLILLFSLALPVNGQNRLLDMSEKLDKLERQDLDAALEKARACTSRRDYACAESALAKAAKAATSAADRRKLGDGRAALDDEREREAQEVRAAEERRVAAEAAERDRIARQEEEERRAEERERQLALERESNAREEPSESTASVLGRYILQKAAENAVTLNKLNRDTTAAFAETKRRIAQQKDERERARRDSDEREAERRREAARVSEQHRAAEDRRLAYARQATEQRATELREAQRQATELRERREREQLAAQQQAERERQQARARAERERRLAQERSERQESERRTNAAEQAERSAYLQRMKREINLVAGKCPDGEGHYYANGTMPRGKEVVACIDVHYEAYCPGSAVVSRGIAKNFVGLAGCFGDTYQIEPKPGCKVSEVIVRVVDVTPGCH